MGTKFRTLLAPINASTGDGRRFGAGAITLADLPMPFEWARSREGGHDGAVVVGAVQEAKVLSVKQALADGWVSEETAKGMDPEMTAVWGRGEMLDDADRERMPRLAEDVAEALHLIGAGTLGPSVDLDTFEASVVMKGTDEPLTTELVDQYMAENDGAEPDLELLITAGRVRAATLVSIPAFSETCRPMELIEQEALVASEGESIDQLREARGDQILTLIASFGDRSPSLPDAAKFDASPLPGPTPITWDWKTGRVFGHIATWRTCHVGYAGVCVTPPREDDTYAWFNRFTVETDGGPIAAGRITVGGRHAGLALSASSAMTEYDGKTTAAHVRAYADEHGIVVFGAIEPGLSAGDMAILERRKVSGDWRDVAGSLALVEVLALSPGPRAHSEPGFPVETYSRAGRQVALTAALGPDADSVPFAAVQIDIPGAVAAELARRDAFAALAATVEADEIRTRADARSALTALLGEE